MISTLDENLFDIQDALINLASGAKVQGAIQATVRASGNSMRDAREAESKLIDTQTLKETFQGLTEFAQRVVNADRSNRGSVNEIMRLKDRIKKHYNEFPKFLNDIKGFA